MLTTREVAHRVTEGQAGLTIGMLAPRAITGHAHAYAATINGRRADSGTAVEAGDEVVFWPLGRGVCLGPDPEEADREAMERDARDKDDPVVIAWAVLAGALVVFCITMGIVARLAATFPGR